MFDTISVLEGLAPTNLDAGEVFSGNYSGKPIKGYAKASLFTPNPNYVFQEQARDLVVWFRDRNDPLYVFGPLGSGKTSLVKELASRLNSPVFEVTGHNRLEFPELAGHLTVKEGQMGFQYGSLSLAMKYGGLFLLNEIDLLDPSTAAGLNSVLDGSPLCVPENGGELKRVASDKSGGHVQGLVRIINHNRDQQFAKQNYQDVKGFDFPPCACRCIAANESVVIGLI